MKVLLSHGYFLKEDEAEQKIMRPYPPLGILYISSFLKSYGIDVDVFDSTFSSKEEQLKKIIETKPRIVALYTNLMTKLNILDIIKGIKKFLPNAIIILGGPDVTYNIENYLKKGADYLVIGEGEVTMKELVEVLFVEGDVNQVNGIAFFNQGSLVKTLPRTKLRNVDELPNPDRDAIDISQYLTTWKKYHGKSALNVSTQRGCPYTCKWCSTAVYGQSYRRRSSESVLKELLEIKQKYNPDSIWFVDDVFTISHKWLNALADQMDKQDLHIPFECISRADRMNKDVIQTLKRMGCFRIWIGAESGSQKIIDAMDRRVSVHKVREMIQETRKVGIEAGTFIMLGYPGETEIDIRETIDHLKASNPDHFTITKAYPIKGTKLYEEVESITTIVPEWSKSTDRQIDFKRTHKNKYYEYAIMWVVNEVNFHKASLQKGVTFYSAKLKIKALVAFFFMQLSK